MSSRIRSVWAGLDIGARVAGVGGLVALVGFFLPIYADSGNGLSLAVGGDIEWWFRLCFAIAAVGLSIVGYNRDLRTKVINGAVQAAIATHWGLQVLRPMQGSYYRAYVDVGWYVVTLGFLGVLVGGFLSVLRGTRPLAGVK